jgi:hypothetical protein
VDQRDNKCVRGKKRDVLYCYCGDKAVLLPRPNPQMQFHKEDQSYIENIPIDCAINGRSLLQAEVSDQ